MVKAKWVGEWVGGIWNEKMGMWIGRKWLDRLVIEPVTTEEEKKLPPFVQDTLNAGMCAICDGVAYAVDESHAREKLEF